MGVSPALGLANPAITEGSPVRRNAVAGKREVLYGGRPMQARGKSCKDGTVLSQASKKPCKDGVIAVAGKREVLYGGRPMQIREKSYKDSAMLS